MATARLPQPSDETSLRELFFLQRLSKAAASTIEPDALLDLIISETTGAMQTDVCSLYLYDAASDSVVLTATNGLSQSEVGRARLKLGQGVTGWVAQAQQPLVVPDVTSEQRFQWVRGVDQERLTSMLSVPILAGSRMVGVVNVQAEEHRDFTRDDIDFLSAIAGQVAGILERSELQRRLEAQLDEIRASQAIHERFTTLALSGGGSLPILDAIAELAEARVEIFDPLGLQLQQEGWKGRGGLGLSRIELPASVRHGSDPAEVSAGKPSRSLLLTPIRAGDELLAVLAAEPAPDHSQAGLFPEGVRRRALEHGATVLALELAKERAAAEVERRLRGNLVEELLTHNLDRAEYARLAGQAERLGHHISSRSWVIVIEPDTEGSSQALETRSLQDRLHDLVNDQCTRRFPGSLIVTRPVSLVLLIPASEGGGAGGHGAELNALESFATTLLRSIHRVLPHASFSAGIGNATEAVWELPRAHDEARQSLRLARRGGGAQDVTSYRNLGAFRLLLEVQNPEALRRFVDEMLGPLLTYEEGRHTPLVETLEALSTHHWNRRAAARALHLHVNSLSYRVERIEVLAGLSLDDPETRVALSVALRARSLLRTS